MKTIFSTADLRPQDRFDAWHEVASRTILPHDAAPKDQATFQGEIEFGQIDKVRLLTWQATPMKVECNAAHIEKTASDDLMLLRFARGHCWSEQDDGRIVPQIGDMVLFDPMQPYTAGFEKSTLIEAMTVPRRALTERIGAARSFPLRLIEANNRDAGMLSAWLSTLPRFVSNIGPAAATRDADYVLDLLAASLAPILNRPLRISSAGRILLQRMERFIEERLGDPNLTRDDIAAFVDISVRHLNRLLGEADRPNISETLIERRLACARQMLANPSHDAQGIFEIAMSCGFKDATHFGRAFKNSFGILPREFRESRRADLRAQTSPMEPKGVSR
jgi:AraC-like DNA-binding protein